MNTAPRPGSPDTEPRATLSLADYRRRVAEMYAEVRDLDPIGGHRHWVDRRAELFATHLQSPIPMARRSGFAGVPVYPYDPALRFEQSPVEPTTGAAIGLPHSGDGETMANAFGSITVHIDGVRHRLTLYWLDEYGGGVFLPFRDATNGSETYGGGRYLLDGAKGADLGSGEATITIDFNFAYHPSCVHDSRWSCPLSPPENTLDVPIRGGERL